jgi:ribosomal protein L35AE/L33A
MDLGNQKGENEKRPPQFLLIQMKGILSKKRAQIVLQQVFMFLKFRNTVLWGVKDEV